MVSGGEREQNDEKVDGRWRPSGEEIQAFHHSSRFLRGFHPRPFLTEIPAVPFLPRQPETKNEERNRVISCLTIAELGRRSDKAGRFVDCSRKMSSPWWRNDARSYRGSECHPECRGHFRD